MASNDLPAIVLASQILAQAITEDIDEVVKQGAGLDRSVQHLLREVGQNILEQVYDQVDHYLIAQCKEEGWEIERHPRVNFKTLFGPVEVGSAYLSKPGEAGGFRPIKEVMGVVGNGYSEAAERALADFGSEKSFGRAAQQFQEHYGWEIDRGTVLRRTEAVAKDSEQYLQERLTGAVGVYQPLPPEAPEETTFVVELDGCEIRMGAFMTAKEAGKTDRDPDERVRDVQWQEVRTGVVRPLEETDKFYVCAKATYPQVCDQLFGMACARGLNSSSVVIAPGDGGNGLREEMEVHFDTIQYILDPGHLKSHFYETANELGIDKKLQQAWVNTHMERLWNNEVETVIANLKDLYQQTKNDRVRRLINHLIRFADAVDYGCFKEKDWPVGSGEVESAHRYVPQERLKIAGACWHPKTVNPMLALRVVRANGWWDTFWQWLHVQRAQQRAA